jgi:hypothetical protein
VTDERMRETDRPHEFEPSEYVPGVCVAVDMGPDNQMIASDVCGRVRAHPLHTNPENLG